MTIDLDEILNGATHVSLESTFPILSKAVRVQGGYTFLCGFYPKKHRNSLFWLLWGRLWAP